MIAGFDWWKGAVALIIVMSFENLAVAALGIVVDILFVVGSFNLSRSGND